MNSSQNSDILSETLCFGLDSSGWNVIDAISETIDIPEWIVKNILKLFDEDNTIPFIARYRKEKTDNMDPEKIREIHELYETLKSVQHKADNVIATVEKLGKMTSALFHALKSAKTMSEIELLYAPYKAGSKRTLAERARSLGLEDPAISIMDGLKIINLQNYLTVGTKGLSTLSEIEIGIKHIISDIVSKHKDVLELIRKLSKTISINLSSSKSKAAEKKNKSAETEFNKANQIYKFENYFNFNNFVSNMKPHQVLAINRGENLKILTVKLIIPEIFKNKVVSLCSQKWIYGNPNRNYPFHQQLIKDSIEDAYNRLIEPFITRQIRSELTKTAEKASIDVFSSNLKKLLLMPPVRGKTILGIDPGFAHGCKIAVISVSGQICETAVLRLHGILQDRLNPDITAFTNLILKHKCETVAIGNGKACRETESLLSNLISSGAFRPLNVMYCIVDESGASIYSASNEAKLEMPNLDINLRSAVSIARRLQDPLVEYVKIEPKHIGVGMYQHDVSENMLKTTLDGVVVECVSFVGLDLNVCTEYVLRKVAGLNATKAKNIIEWRNANGHFVNREQLRLVKGLGPKSFEQCAGFVRILPSSFGGSSTIGKNEEEPEEFKKEAPSTSQNNKRKAASQGKAKTKKLKKAVESVINPLDMTTIHPESYHIAKSFLKKINAKPEEIGEISFIHKVKQFIDTMLIKSLAEELETGEATLRLIIDNFQTSIDYDIRSEFEKPLFRKGTTSIEEISKGMILTGQVRNITPFGAFVDIGVGESGLIHVSKMPHYVLKNRTLQLGDRVTVKVLNIEIQRRRIGLELLKIN